MKFCSKMLKNVSECFENIFFEKYIPKLTWEWLSIVVFEPEPTFFMGGNNFYFFTPKYLGFISKKPRNIFLQHFEMTQQKLSTKETTSFIQSSSMTTFLRWLFITRMLINAFRVNLKKIPQSPLPLKTKIPMSNPMFFKS